MRLTPGVDSRSAGQGSPLRQFALPIMCDIAKASKRARAELKQHNGVQFYLGLLSTSYWQVSRLQACASRVRVHGAWQCAPWGS